MSGYKSLNHGMDYKSLKNKLNKKTTNEQLNRIISTGDKNIEFKEPMTNFSNNLLVQEQHNNITEIQNLENEFNNTLTKYINTYQENVSNLNNKNNITKNNDIIFSNEILLLNDELIHLANSIKSKIEELTIDDTKLQTSIEKSTIELNDRIQKLQIERKTMGNINANVETLNKDFSNIKQMVKSSYYEYIIWSISAITICGIAFYHMR